jgi:hypothetical protein
MAVNPTPSSFPSSSSLLNSGAGCVIGGGNMVLNQHNSFLGGGSAGNSIFCFFLLLLLLLALPLFENKPAALLQNIFHMRTVIPSGSVQTISCTGLCADQPW